MSLSFFLIDLDGGHHGSFPIDNVNKTRFEMFSKRPIRSNRVAVQPPREKAFDIIPSQPVAVDGVERPVESEC